MQDDSQLIQEFVAEATEHLASVEQHLLALEDPHDPASHDRINEVFRAVHSMKGVSAFLGLETFNNLAHHAENLLNLMRHGEVPATGDVIEALLAAADRMKQMIANVGQSSTVEINDLLQLLDRVGDSATGSQPAEASESALAQVARIERFAAELLSAPMVEPAPIEPAPIAPAPAASRQPAAEAELVEPLAIPPAAESLSPSPPTVPSSAPLAQPARPMANVAAATDNTVRVPVAVLERLMNLAGELVLSRNQLLRVVATRKKRGIETLSSRIDQVTTELQEAIMCSRMQQIGIVFNRFPRLVRDLCKKLDKQCQLIIEGGEVELDKTILEAMADPLTHLVRNALDHGIETPARRAEAGKPAVGTLTLRAFHQAGKVNITLSEDGAGIDRQRVLAKAISRGLVLAHDAAQMSDRDVIGLVFQPGFSTAEVVTDVSGRGVGMDVVKTNIEKLGGTVEIESQFGGGTTVHVALPLTLAIIPSLVIEDGGLRFALPEVSIRELVRIAPNDSSVRIERLQRTEVLRLRGELLPLLRLGRLFDPVTTTAGKRAPPSASGAAVLDNLIIVECGLQRIALAVEIVRDPEQIVVKPLGRHLRSCRILAGTTVLGDGQIAYILDLSGLAHQAQLITASHAAVPAATEQDRDSRPGEAQTTLLFRNSKHELLGVPMAMIARIERIAAGTIKTTDGRMLLPYNDSCLPLLAAPGDPSGMLVRQEDCYVLVCRIEGHEVGLVVPTLVDIRDVTAQIETGLFDNPSIMGTLMIDGEVCRLLDAVELVAQAVPGAAAAVRKRADEKPRKVVLLAEDSKFFRQQVQRFLETDGYQVIAFEDGQLAWNALESGRVRPSVVVTDIEMPNMNGYELCTKIRADERHGKLPVIALTSLSSEEHFRRGREVGVTDYQVKMDRDRLSTAVRELIENGVSGQ